MEYLQCGVWRVARCPADGRCVKEQRQLPRAKMCHLCIYIYISIIYVSLAAFGSFGTHFAFSLLHKAVHFSKVFFCIAHCTDEDQKSETIVCSRKCENYDKLTYTIRNYMVCIFMLNY